MPQKTKLNKWYDMINEGESYPVYTRDSWTIQDDGTKIFCTGWMNGENSIRPYGDGCHVVIGWEGGDVFHCDQVMEILSRWEKDGYKWKINVPLVREQYINGSWIPVKTNQE